MEATSLKGIPKEIAKALIQKACNEGYKLDNVSDIEKMLRQCAKAAQLPQNYFKCLRSRELCDIWMSCIRHSQQRSASSISHNSFGPLPPSSPGPSEPSEEDGQSIGNCSDPGLEAAQDEGLSVTYEDAKRCDITLWNAKLKKHELVTANRCKEMQSYIAAGIIRRFNLSPDKPKDRTIRLTWEDQDPQKEEDKSKSTRFQIVPDHLIEFDVVIGQAWNEPDPYESSDLDEDDDNGGEVEEDSDDVSEEQDDDDDESVEEDKDYNKDDNNEAVDDGSENLRVDYRLDRQRGRSSSTRERPMVTQGQPARALTNEARDLLADMLLRIVHKNSHGTLEEVEEILRNQTNSTASRSKRRDQSKQKSARQGSSSSKKNLPLRTELTKENVRNAPSRSTRSARTTSQTTDREIRAKASG